MDDLVTWGCVWSMNVTWSLVKLCLVLVQSWRDCWRHPMMTGFAVRHAGH